MNRFKAVDVLGTCASDTSFIEVIYMDAPTAFITNPSNETFCEGEFYLIEVQIDGAPSFNLTYSIDGQLQPDTVVANNNLTGFPANQNGVYTLHSVFGSNGCIGTVGSEIVTINLIDTPNPPTITANTPNFCTGSLIDLFANGAGGNYTWYSDANLQNQTDTGDQTSLIVNMGNNSIWLTEEANGCVSDPTEFSFEGLNSFNLYLPDSIMVCQNEEITITAISNAIPTWSDGSNGTEITLAINSDTTINCYLYSSCDTLEAQIFVGVNASPNVSAGEDQYIPIGWDTELSAQGAEFYQWSTNGSVSCDTCQTTMTPELFTGQAFYLMGVDSNGCTNYDTIFVHIFDEVDLYMPNVFSPNGDGANDTFGPEGVPFETFILKVFNRWGQQIFSTTTPGERWDGYYQGELMHQGVYAYRLEGKLINGVDAKLAGNVLLVRW